MGTTTHDLIQWPLTNDIKNAYKMLNVDLADVGPDRAVTPDGHSLIVEMWNSGVSMDDMMQELR
ncbi:MAG: hypothetical protein QMD85_03770, partial [Candidatus Aenigmarchaeota archaeon]|nr:hypothetical protein [Candidatus Aenigmarchaeota archaeon]